MPPFVIGFGTSADVLMLSDTVRSSSSDDAGMEPKPRRYRFTITVDVEPGHPAYDHPEWAADAAWRALANEYDLRATYSATEEVERNQPI